MNWYKKAKIRRESGLRDVIKNLMIGGASLAAIVSVLSTQFPEIPKEKIQQEVQDVSSQENSVENFDKIVEEPVEDIVETPSIKDSNLINMPQLFDQLKLHEGYRLQAYDDATGKPYFGGPKSGKITIGIGYNMDRAGGMNNLKSTLGLTDDQAKQVYNGRAKLSDEQVYALFSKDLASVRQEASSWLPNFQSQPTVVKHIVIDMLFNMGLNKMNGFKNMKEALMNNDYERAADEMVNSSWFGQVKTRGKTLVNQMRGVGK